MRAPLSVRVSSGGRDRLVSRHVRGLSFTKTAPGGHHSASMRLDAPNGLLSDLGPDARVYVYDGRNARPVWDGYVENPGRQSVPGGDTYDLSAMGGLVLASDNARAVVFVDRDPSSGAWEKGGSVSSATAEVVQTTPGNAGFKLQFNPGTPVETGSYVSERYTALNATGQPLRHFRAYATGGKTDSNHKVSDAAVSPSPFVAASGPYLSLDTATMNLSIDLPVTSESIPPNPLITMLLNSISPTNIADDTTWVRIDGGPSGGGIVIRAGLMDQSGVYVNGAATTTVLASEVVAHLIGSGMLPMDGNTSSIAATSALIRQLTYLDAAKPGQILDDLALYEPNVLWEILETQPNGKHRFNYRAWPTEPRYEISGRDFVETGGEHEQANRVAVSWTDATGAQQSIYRTASVPALAAVGRTVDAEPIVLPDGKGDRATAEWVGDQTLAALNAPTRAGTAVIDQPIYDRLRNRMAYPWQIEPGYLVRVRDKGIDLRLTEMTYDDTDVSTTITLGSPVLSQEQRLAGIA